MSVWVCVSDFLRGFHRRFHKKKPEKLCRMMRYFVQPNGHNDGNLTDPIIVNGVCWAPFETDPARFFFCFFSRFSVPMTEQKTVSNNADVNAALAF